MAETTKSPVFSSPAYWIALGIGVVGIGAAAIQERKGSAAKNGGGFVCVNDRYCPHEPDTFASLADFQDMCEQVFGDRAHLTRRGSDYVDEHGQVVLRPVASARSSGSGSMADMHGSGMHGMHSSGDMHGAGRMAGMHGAGSMARYDESRDEPGLYPISSLRPGAYFKRKADAKKVYRKGDYDRSERTYAGLDTDDIGRSIALKGDTRVYVGFDY